MQEKTPVYIKELKEDIKDLKNHIDQKFEKIDEKLEMHFETIGEIKVQVTEISLNLQNKASYEFVKDIDKRTEKLEKAVFA